MSRKRPRSPSPLEATFRSSSIEDRSSTFIAIYSPTASAISLQAYSDFKTASHRVAAWRKPGSQRSLSGQQLYESGYDDDGEQYAGKRLVKVLSEMNVEGSIVVARWYGGVLLGPVRFEHIENCAREAIRKSLDVESPAQKRKIEDRRKELIRTLEMRDESVTILRGLLAEKTKAKGLDEKVVADRPKKPDYSVMTLEVLKRLESARDATISWILKEIDKVEQSQKPIDEVDTAKVINKISMDEKTNEVDKTNEFSNTDDGTADDGLTKTESNSRSD